MFYQASWVMVMLLCSGTLHGIRPAYYYQDEEIVVVCSERPVIQTAFNTPFNKIKELPRGNAIIIKKRSCEI